MSSVKSAITHRAIHQHFKKLDPRLADVIKQVGPVTLKPVRDRFKILVYSIIAQQISTSAARSIRKRFEERLRPCGVRPEAIACLSVEQFREAGISRQKASYLSDLAQKCCDGSVRLARLGRMADEQVIEELTQVKGIGRWSAQMFLIFSLGRLDVFPIDDLGVRTAISRLHNLKSPVEKSRYQEIGDRWRPYASLGSWYCWRFLELNPVPRVRKSR
jgi:DNA-3-methyladenine glycosylase II